MAKIYQSFNKRTKRWFKYRLYADGHTIITDNKQIEPSKKFKGVPVRRGKK